MSLNELYTVKEVSWLLKTSRVQVRKMIQTGELPAVMVGREYRIPAEVLNAFIRSNLS
jgi:excisionase family DNA binding protein